MTTSAAAARRCVLRARCDHFRARCESGMKDAGDAELPMPDHFSEARPAGRVAPVLCAARSAGACPAAQRGMELLSCLCLTYATEMQKECRLCGCFAIRSNAASHGIGNYRQVQIEAAPL